ncbi:MAG: hypothetical protein IPL28_18180 [Chloroflexi bacterium]|nr:hypothetical protein [Chloroflexota bacterium]
MGGPGGDIASQALASANAGGTMFQTAMWNEGDQILTVFRLTTPTTPSNPYLIVSLNRISLVSLSACQPVSGSLYRSR